jgi:hypothetical protein
MTVRIDEAKVRELLNGKGVVWGLAEEARRIQRSVSPPAGLETDHRAGVGPRGPFSQAIVRGRGAVAWEYGGRNTPPAGQLRAALRRGRA